jgi:subtilisin family serine protease
MKKLSEILNPSSQRYFYYNGTKTYLNSIREQLLITFKNALTRELKMSLLNEIDKSKSLLLDQDIPQAVDRYLLVTFDVGASIKLSSLVTFDLPDIESVSPVFSSNKLISRFAFTNEIFINIKAGMSIPTSFFEKYGIAYGEHSLGNNLLLTVKPNNNFDTLDVANALYESGYCEFAEPNFFRILNSYAYSPNDPYFPFEWQIPTIGANEAWCWTSGQNTSIGIMDVGINTSHEDLIGNFQGSYDPTGQPLGADSHGTLCAGAALAVGNNGIGVVGISYSSRLYQLRIGYNPTNDPNNPSFYSTDAWVVGALNYAITNNISCVSCSFSTSPSSAVNAAIISYTTSARGGLGGVMLAATGNDSTNIVAYPASHPNVLAVGASDFNDQRATFSNYGAQQAFLAPGVFIATTKYNGSYDTSFSGTSAACPIAAGAAALILSISPNFTRAQVRNALSSSCSKVGGYSYYTQAGDPYSRSAEAGYGRIDINNYFKAFYSISAPDWFCGSQQQYQLTNLFGGINVSWSSSNPDLTINNGGLLTNNSGQPGRTVLTATLSNTCVEPREKIVVVGSFPEEVWATVQGDDPISVPWAAGNQPNQILPIKSNSLGQFPPTAVYFGYAPFIGKSTLNPPNPSTFWYDNQGWILSDNGVTNLEVISAPATWQTYPFSGSNTMFVITNGDASGLLVVRLQLPCGAQDVTFYIQGT